MKTTKCLDLNLTSCKVLVVQLTEQPCKNLWAHITLSLLSFCIQEVIIIFWLGKRIKRGHHILTMLSTRTKKTESCHLINFLKLAREKMLNWLRCSRVPCLQLKEVASVNFQKKPSSTPSKSLKRRGNKVQDLTRIKLLAMKWVSITQMPIGKDCAKQIWNSYSS